MTRWLLRRLLQATVTFAVAVLLLFILMRVTPGDPLSRLTEDRDASAQEIAQLRARYGLDQPIGKGVVGSVDGRSLVIGNQRIMSEAGIDTASLSSTADELRREGATAIFVALDGKSAGIIAIADPIKATTPAAIAALQSASIRVVMVTGDNKTTARAVANELGVTEVIAEKRRAMLSTICKVGETVVIEGEAMVMVPARGK